MIIRLFILHTHIEFLKEFKVPDEKPDTTLVYISQAAGPQ